MITEFAILVGFVFGYFICSLLSMNSIDEYKSTIHRLEISNAHLRELLSSRRELKYTSDKESRK